MEEIVSKNLTDLKLAVNENDSPLRIGMFLDEVSIDESLEACVTCLESNNLEIREMGVMYSEGMSTHVVYKSIAHKSLRYLLSCQESKNEKVREFAKRNYELFSSSHLASRLNILFDELDSPFTLVRFYASELSEKINAADLNPNFKLLCDFYNNGKGDVKRVAKKLLIKIMQEFKVEAMIENLPIIEEFQKSDNEELKNLADWMYLMVANKTWSFNRLCTEKPAIIKYRDSESDKVKELAAYLFIGIVESWPVSSLEPELDYFVSMLYFSDEEVHWKSREIALAVLESYSPENPEQLQKLYEKHDYLINCRKAKSFHVRRKVKALLKKIPAQMFFKDVKALMNWYASGFNELRPTLRKILFKIPADMFIDILENLIDVQKSGDPEQRYLASELAVRINPKVLKTKKDYIKSRIDSGYPDLQILARELNFLIS